MEKVKLGYLLSTVKEVVRAGFVESVNLEELLFRAEWEAEVKTKEKKNTNQPTKNGR